MRAGADLPAPQRVEALRAALASGKPSERLAAIHEAGRLRAGATGLVPDLAALLPSEDYVPCTALEYDVGGHAVLAFDAMQAIEAIGVAPDAAVLRGLLTDHRLIELPEPCYDQGAYIGDYAWQTVAPAGLAARLVRLAGIGGFDLLPELATNARHAVDKIAEPALHTLTRLVLQAGAAGPAAADRLRLTIEALAGLPEAMAPTTARGFALRDLAALYRKTCATGG